MAGGAAAGGGGATHLNVKANGMTYISIAIVMMGAAMFGADQNNYGVVQGLTDFQEHWCPGFNFGDEVNCSAIVDMDEKPGAWNWFITLGGQFVNVGMMLGALTLGPLMATKTGRRITISTGGLLCFAGTCITAFLAGKSVPIYYVGRFVTGFGCGIACYALPMYNAEVATPGIRGLTGSLFQFMVVIGGFIAVAALARINWKQGFLIPGYFGLAVASLVWLCPESPRYVIDRQGKEAGRPHLQKVRAGNIDEELDYMDQALKEERAAGSVSYIELVTKPGLRKRLFVACYLQVAQQLTGVNAFLAYQATIFSAAGYKSVDVNNFPFGPSMMVQWIFVVGSVTGLLLIDSPYGGRKKQLLAAGVFMGPPLFAAAFQNWFAPDAGMITAAGVWIFSFGFQLAWGIIPWFYPAELFQMNEREKALSISTFFGFGFNLIVGFATDFLFEWSKGGMFMIYAVLNITNVFFVIFGLVETKGMNLEDIPAMFGPVDKQKGLLDAA
jgi:sugar porter (SP) family MFS transporter